MAASLASDPKSASKLLTVIITTSPTPSAPSTDLLSTVFASFSAHCTSLLTCPVIVVFDTYDRIVTKARLKKGQVTPGGAAVYGQYKENVKELVMEAFGPVTGLARTTTEDEAEYGSPCDKNKTHAVRLSIESTDDRKVTWIEPSERLGFGLAVRSALRVATTPFAWVHQHDWKLDAPIPLDSLLDVMQASADDPMVPVNYVCFPSPRMLGYATSADVELFPALKASTAALRRDFSAREGEKISLTPLFFWHDKPHLVSRRHYLERVFPSRLAISRGDFIEDSVGQRAREQMKAGSWVKWACWLYAPGGGQTVCVRHLHGRVWKGDVGQRGDNERKKEAGQRRRAAELEARVVEKVEADDDAAENYDTYWTWRIS